MFCQNCKRKLPDVAETCKCGWSRDDNREAGFVHCANEDCPNCATARVKTPTGFANFCPTHYEKYWIDQARMFCVSRGMDTKDKQYKFCRETIAGMRGRIGA